MPSLIQRYTRWLHTRWPAGTVEKFPEVNEDGTTNVPGMYVVGDLTGVPLLKFSSDSGARAIRRIAEASGFQPAKGKAELLDVAIIGAGVSGMAAALEAKKRGLSFTVIEATEPFSTILNFPKGKPIYTYPTDMAPAGDLQFSEKSDIKEGLVEELREKTLGRGIEPLRGRVEAVRKERDAFRIEFADREPLRARRVVVGIGRSGNFRTLDVPGEDRDKVYNRLYDPRDYEGKQVLVVGGGDSAMESAIALAGCGAQVTLSYRKSEFSRPKPENVQRLKELAANPEADAQVERPSSERVTTSSGDFVGRPPAPGSITLMMSSHVKEIRAHTVLVEDRDGNAVEIGNEAVFSMIGREPPLDFFRRSGVNIRGEWRAKTWITFTAFVAFCFLMYHWKAEGWGLWLVNPQEWMDALAGVIPGFDNPKHLFGVLRSSFSQPWVWYTAAYALVVTVFGFRRIHRRRTPYITVQTLVLMAIQVVPLFLLPCILLPWAYRNGWFDNGLGQWMMAEFFPAGESDFWRAFGFILAWPLMVWNVFTDEPMVGWLVVSAVQTFVIIPLIIFRWGKGAYCGWICSCGALAETLGDAHRHKMPHGPVWNRVNMVGQGVLLFAFVILFLRILGWVFPGSPIQGAYEQLAARMPVLNYKYLVDLWLAGILGVGLYFHFSGRVWCRFACPLAALMHIYARFSRFRIVADKKRCISCNVCTSVCHQGIDVMNFANKGLPMADPQCVRCSACVYSCPTGVLQFGRVDPGSGRVLGLDPLPASPVLMRELRKPAVPRSGPGRSA